MPVRTSFLLCLPGEAAVPALVADFGSGCDAPRAVFPAADKCKAVFALQRVVGWPTILGQERHGPEGWFFGDALDVDIGTCMCTAGLLVWMQYALRGVALVVAGFAVYGCKTRRASFFFVRP